MNVAFEIARNTGNNFAESRQRVNDSSAIESILSQASQSGDPKVLQDSIGQILSQVSPERQGSALKYLESAYKNVEAREKMGREQAAAKEGGYTYGAPPQVQAAQYKENAKDRRMQGANDVFNTSSGQPQTSNVPQSQNAPPNSNVSNKQKLLQLTAHPDREVSERAKAELKNIETQEKLDRADQREFRKETLPLKKEIIDRANNSRESIRNKTHLMELIDTGNLNDPTFAIFAESLPFNIGKRMLSEETVEYKGGLVDEFADLKNIFKGATRVKEVEIYENKLADLYLTDSQKKAILKSRINTAKIDIIREEAAAEIEEKYPNITALQFSKKVDELAKPKVDALFNSIWDEQKAVFDQASARKGIPLDFDDPEDKQILSQLMKESGGDRNKARVLAKKKGYIIGK